MQARGLKSAVERELCGACRVIFGPEVDINRDFLFYVAPSGVKSAYRRRALAIHPDRAFGQDDAARRTYTELFVRTNLAYERLMDFLRERDDYVPASRPPSDAGRGEKAEGVKPRPIFPRRRLLLGEFLLYSGAVPWEALARALAWQRRQRPRFGELAVSWDWLTGEEVELVILKKRRGERIGEAAVRLGLLEHFQAKVLSAYQRSRQRQLGAYFVENGYLSDARLEGLISEFMRHNARFGERGFV